MQTYNGWTNYETWAVNLWLDNDEGTQDYWLEQAGIILANCDNDARDATYELAASLQEDLEDLEMWGVHLPNGPHSDLLAHALGMVDWREIASYMIEVALDEEAS
jgi:hypothetical protein